MRWAKTIWSQFFGLFVDDGSFAAAILAWLVLCWVALPRGLALSPALLFAGQSAILLASATRRARHKPRP